MRRKVKSASSTGYIREMGQRVYTNVAQIKLYMIQSVPSKSHCSNYLQHCRNKISISTELSSNSKSVVLLKGVPARESHTGTRLVSPAAGCEKKK